MPPLSVILQGSMDSVPPSPSYHLAVWNICTYLLLIVNHVYLLTSWLSFVWTSCPRLFGACRAWIIGIFFLQWWWIGYHIYFPKFHFEMFNSFSCVWSSWYCTCVLALLNLYLVFFCCDLLVVFHVIFLIIRVILVVLYLNILFCLFIVVNCDIIIDFDVGLVIKFLISCNFIT